MVDSVFESVMPTLKFLDVEKCEVISQCLKQAQQEKEALSSSEDKGVYKNEVWKLYKKQMNVPDSEKFVYFDFDEQMTNMYRSGAFFADSEFNKVSLNELPGYKTF